MSRILLVVCALAALAAANIRKVPNPQKGFDIKRIQGVWFSQYFKQPCTFKGSQDHSNHRHEYRLKSGYLSAKDTYRGSKGDCVRDIPARLELTDKPGVFKTFDNLGNTMEGINIVVAIDYKCFVIEWGCTGRIKNGVCDDAWVSAKTRKRIPDPWTWKKILHALKKLFDIPESEVIRRDQSSPCKPDPPYPKKHHVYKPTSHKHWEPASVGMSNADLNGLDSMDPAGPTGFDSMGSFDFVSVENGNGRDNGNADNGNGGNDNGANVPFQISSAPQGNSMAHLTGY